MRLYTQNLNGLPVSTLPSTPAPASNGWLDTIQQALPGVVATVTAAQNQRRINKMQRQRLERGEKLLTADEIDRYMDATAPVVKVKGGVDNNTSKAMMYGGIAVGLGVVYMMMNRPKAR